MKEKIILLFLFATFVVSNGFSQDMNNLANTPRTISDPSNSFVIKLEQIEMDFIGNGKHWRKGDFPPYKFHRCDVAQDRARISYIREDKRRNRLTYFLVYFEKTNNIWSFSFNDSISMPKIQPDGTQTTLWHVLKTRNKMYWLSSDYLKEGKHDE